MGLSIFPAFLVLCILPVIKSQVLNYTITPIATSGGLYYEPMHHVRFTKAEWKLVTYIDMKTFETQKPNVTKIMDMIKQVENVCDRDRENYECNWSYDKNNIITKMQHGERYFNQLQSFLDNSGGDTVDSALVKRSAPFGFIGTINKALFGTLTEDDAAYYDAEIDKLFNDQKKTSKLVVDQTHIVQTELHSLHDELEKIKNVTNIHTDILKETLRNIQSFEKNVNFIEYRHNVQVWGNLVQTEIDNYLHALELVVEAIYFAKLGLIHPELVSTDQLEDIVSRFLKNNENKEFIFPLSLQEVRGGVLSEISHLASGYRNGKLILVLNVPLLDSQNYNLYKLQPYPTPQPFGDIEKGSAYIHPRSDYLLVSQEQTRYTLINTDDLPSCSVTRNYHICIPKYPFYESAMEPICEISLITKMKDKPLEDCDIRISKVFKPFWKQLSNYQGWLYSVPKKEHVQILCGGNSQQVAEISGAGILHINPGCKALTPYALMYGHQTFSDSSEYEYKTFLSLNVTELLPQIINYEPLFGSLNISDIPPVKETPYVPGALSYDVKLSEIVREMEEINHHKRDKLMQRSNTFKIIIVQIIIVVLFLLYILRNPIILGILSIFGGCCSRTRQKLKIKKQVIKDETENEHIYDEVSAPSKKYENVY